ncbi:hypothetical protein [Corynebacterium guangdongense]|uniref:DUF4333 domain-containing protein n=1 Tax=Corynebacterium guangdongense TaxID=1783348 RepID=A0ABU1ZXF8_9CORY|nr:hypothetical protein [Corynebacterium guangdongense]MDR7329624.1 hypothetical protein [Corynebacterium guangdongense]WJZ18189.1 hypothetical protein CGUA_08135 [Corynebacterium guangdongense]
MKIVLVLAAAAALAGCAPGLSGPPGRPESVPEASTETRTVAQTPAPASTTVSPTPPPAGTSASAGSGPAPLPYDTQPGETVSIRGEAARVCVTGDGFALNVVAAGMNTSCEFSIEILDALTRGLNPTYDNVREHLPRTVTAHSPVTGQAYEMTCRQDDGILVTCTGGLGAKIWMY